MNPSAAFDESDIRAAERRLEASLQAEDPTAWVFDYTEAPCSTAVGTTPSWAGRR